MDRATLDGGAVSSERGTRPVDERARRASAGAHP
jgi:hypothetical protein